MNLMDGLDKKSDRFGTEVVALLRETWSTEFESLKTALDSWLAIRGEVRGTDLALDDGQSDCSLYDHCLAHLTRELWTSGQYQTVLVDQRSTQLIREIADRYPPQVPRTAAREQQDVAEIKAMPADAGSKWPYGEVGRFSVALHHWSNHFALFPPATSLEEEAFLMKLSIKFDTDKEASERMNRWNASLEPVTRRRWSVSSRVAKETKKKDDGDEEKKMKKKKRNMVEEEEEVESKKERSEAAGATAEVGSLPIRIEPSLVRVWWIIQALYLLQVLVSRWSEACSGRRDNKRSRFS